MSTFAVKVVKIKALEPIPGADVIELAVVGDYRSVVRKGDFYVGSFAVYIPEASIVPTWLLRVLNLEGKLSGKDKNRVKAIKLRGCLSQGILMKAGVSFPGVPQELPEAVVPRPKDPAHPNGGMPDDTSPLSMSDEAFFIEGDNVADWLGITKWEPAIPASMAGEVYSAGQHLTVPYDIENYKWFPDVFKDGEEVVFTEKLHGTFCGVGVLPKHDHSDDHYQREFVVFSKGLGSKGLCFKDVPANMQNVYFRGLQATGVFDALRSLRDEMEEEHGFPHPLFILGEVFGGDIQDKGWYSKDVQFRLFDVCAGYRGDQHFFGFEGRRRVAEQLGIGMVPVLYRGPFSKDVMMQYTSGKETVSGSELNMREGIVITPVEERRIEELGRVILKSVSPEYLLRNGGTEFN